MAQLSVLRDIASLNAAAASRLTDLVDEAIAAHGNAMVSLTGGNTPRALYRLLADPAHPWRTRIDWSRVYLFWGDERQVPPDDPDSNFGMANEALIRHVPIPPANVHRMRGEVPDANEAARLYEAELRDAFADAGRKSVTFDIMLLGLGDNAHIASIFPGSPLLADLTRSAPPVAGRADLVRSAAVPAAPSERITMTPPVIVGSRHIVMFVAGDNKADAVYDALEAPLDVTRYPVQMLRAVDDRVEWFMDSRAAARLPDAPRA